MLKRRWKDIAVGLVVPAIAIAVWQLAASMGWVNANILPSPLAVWNKWVAYLLPMQDFNTWHEMNPEGGKLAWAFSGELIIDSLGSLYRVVVGFAVGAILALPLGLAMGASSIVYAWMNPLVQLLRPIP